MQKSDIEAITGARILADMESSCFKKVCCNVYLTEFQPGKGWYESLHVERVVLRVEEPDLRQDRQDGSKYRFFRR